MIDDPACAAADPACIVQGPRYRFSVLTSRLVRMEWNEQGAFVDLPTQLAQRRRFPVPEFTVRDRADSLDIWTEHLHVRYDKSAFSPGGLAITLRTRAQATHRTRWQYGDVDQVLGRGLANLGGTARTLDDVDGARPLDPGLLAAHGYAVVDDSAAVQLTPDGWLEPRSHVQQDLYFFGYGRDHRSALRDFFHLTGPSPLLPRYALGNWWSRFHRYTAEEYLELMDRFRAAGIPFSVAVLDMDWHLVDIDPELGTGWTGYTWDTDLFPDPPAFLAALHDRGLAVSLNVHPADGVRRHEEAYPEVARALGLDPDSGLEIAFDITSPEFVAAYLEHLHHPHEAAGVDFWWIDWQSGTATRIPGLDPLWMLNHLHHRDAARDGDRPLILSRYAGLGSHRYPVGFSGDTIATWASLDFQPEFTATAANVGYFWWSHDIGGHAFGAKDAELAVRWYQFGAFSPICRLHSSRSPFNSKEPWRFEPHTCSILIRYLRLRHQLVPYLYSAMWQAHVEGIGPVRPMYHDHPDAPEAYQVPNQYLFGPDLLVAPITTPADRATHLAEVQAWLPPGRWFDLFSGRRYQGGRVVTLHRTVEDLPVLARAGAIVPMALDPMLDPADNPQALDLRVFPDAGGATVLHEDDGRGAPTSDDRQDTTIHSSWRDDADGTAEVVLTIAPPTGPGVMTRRTLRVTLIGVAGIGAVTCRAGASPVDGRWEPTRTATALVLDVGTIDLTDGLELVLRGVRRRAADLRERLFALLDQAEIAYALKDEALSVIDELSGVALAAALHQLGLPGNLSGALLEALAADPA